MKSNMLNHLKRIINGDVPTAATEDLPPALSLVVIVYDMQVQAERTLLSLSPQYQEGVSESDYEVIVVENESANNLSRDFVERLPANFSYHLRAERESTPVHAVNHGVGISRGRYVCIMIDGARLVTPGVVKNILRGHRLHERSVVTVPGYHIGNQLQQTAVEQGYGVEQDQALIDSIAWPMEGYRLFEIACFSGSCVPGFFLPNSESNCISIPRDLWATLGGLDTRFDLRGGGLVNLDLYKRACEFPGVEHVMLLGEGTFHQFHGGVTTGGEAGQIRDALIEEMKAQYIQIRGYPYESPRGNPVYLGECPVQVMRFIEYSSARALASQEGNASAPAATRLSAQG